MQISVFLVIIDNNCSNKAEHECRSPAAHYRYTHGKTREYGNSQIWVFVLGAVSTCHKYSWDYCFYLFIILLIWLVIHFGYQFLFIKIFKICNNIHVNTTKNNIKKGGKGGKGGQEGQVVGLCCCCSCSRYCCSHCSCCHHRHSRCPLPLLPLNAFVRAHLCLSCCLFWQPPFMLTGLRLWSPPLVHALFSVCLLVPVFPCLFVSAQLYWLALMLVAVGLFICWSPFHACPLSTAASNAAAVVVITTTPTGIAHTYVRLLPAIHSQHSVMPVTVIHAVFRLVHPCICSSFIVCPFLCSFASTSMFVLLFIRSFGFVHACLVPACWCVCSCLFALVWAPLSASNTQYTHYN